MRPASSPGGETTLADGYRFLDSFSPAERQRLLHEVREWRSRPAPDAEGVPRHHFRAPALQTRVGTLIIRFSTFDLRRDCAFTSRYIDSGRALFDEHHIAVRITQGSILIWDNWRMPHARTAFTDGNRHLRGVLIGAAG